MDLYHSRELAEELFTFLDIEGNGFVTLEELIDRTNFEDSANGFSRSQLLSVFSALDKEDEGKITLEDFTEAFIQLTGSREGQNNISDVESEDMDMAGSQAGSDLFEACEEENEQWASESFSENSKSIDTDNRCANAEYFDHNSVESAFVFDEDESPDETHCTKTAQHHRTSSSFCSDGPSSLADDVFEGEGLVDHEERRSSVSSSRSPGRRQSVLKSALNLKLTSLEDSFEDFAYSKRSPPDGDDFPEERLFSSPHNLTSEVPIISVDTSSWCHRNEPDARRTDADNTTISHDPYYQNLDILRDNGECEDSSSCPNVTSNEAGLLRRSSRFIRLNDIPPDETDEDLTHNRESDKLSTRHLHPYDNTDTKSLGDCSDVCECCQERGLPRGNSRSSICSSSHDYDERGRTCTGASFSHQMSEHDDFETFLRESDPNTLKIYDRILSYSAMSLCSEFSRSRSLDMLDVIEGVGGEDPQMETWEMVLKRLGGASIFSGNPTLKYLWHQLSVTHSDLLQPFEDFLKHVIDEIQRGYFKCQELEETISSKTEQHDREMASVYEEMDQLLIREKDQLQEQFEEREEHQRNEFNKILEMRERELQDAFKARSELETKYESVVDDYHDMKSTKDRMERQLNHAIGAEFHLRQENDHLRQENHALSSKVNTCNKAITELKSHLVRVSKIAEIDKDKYRRCMHQYQNVLEEKDFLDMNITNITQELDELRKLNKNLQERVDSNFSTGMRWRDFDNNHSPIQSPTLSARKRRSKRNTRTSHSPRNSKIESTPERERSQLPSESSFDEDTTIRPVANPPVTSTPLKVNMDQIMLGPNNKGFKVIFVGDAEVGKSSLIRKICRGTFNSQREVTVDPDCFDIALCIKDSQGNDKQIALQLWDTVGQERFNSLPPSYFRKSDVVILMYDIVEEISFINARSWMKTIHEYTDENVLLVLVGNKTDLDHKRQVKVDKAVRLAKENDAIFLETSAKTGDNVSNLCNMIGSTLLEKDDTLLIRESSVDLLEHNFTKRKKNTSCCQV